MIERAFSILRHRLWAAWWISTAALFVLADSPNTALFIAFIMAFDQARDLDKLTPTGLEKGLSELGRAIVRDMMKGHDTIRFTGPGVISQATREAEYEGTTLRITVSAMAKEPVA